MYKKAIFHETQIDLNNKKEGETIEDKVTRLIQNKEPIKDGVPIIFTDRNDGVNAAYNIRTDRWEIAVEAMDKISKMKTAQAEELVKTPEVKTENKGVGTAESLQGLAI